MEQHRPQLTYDNYRENTIRQASAGDHFRRILKDNRFDLNAAQGQFDQSYRRRVNS